MAKKLKCGDCGYGKGPVRQRGIVVIYKAHNMTRKERLNFANWLRVVGDYLVKYGRSYSENKYVVSNMYNPYTRAKGESIG